MKDNVSFLSEKVAQFLRNIISTIHKASRVIIDTSLPYL